MKPLIIILNIVMSLSAATGAQASSSDWFEMEGARIRLATVGEPDARGNLRGVLEIALRPGWKTYWREPGDAGVPPTIDVSASPNVLDAVLDFPPPQRHDERDFQWAGYDFPVSLPVTFTFGTPAGSREIAADVFLGVCETICVPVQARLVVDPDRDPGNARDRMAVTQAFAAIPQAATADFGVTVLERIGDRIVLAAAFPGNPESAELFVAGEQGATCAMPTREARDSKTVFVTDCHIPDGSSIDLHYTLVTDAGAVNGLLPDL